MVVDDAVDDEETKAGPCLLGRVIGLKDAADLVGRDTGTVVADGEEDIFIVATGAHGDLSVAAHRLTTVADEIVEDLLQLVLVDVEERQPLGEVEGHSDAAIGDLGSDEVHCFLDQFIEVGRHGHGTHRAHRVEEFFDDEVEAFDLAAGDLEGFEQLSGEVGIDALPDFPFDDLEVDVERVERVPDLVGDTGGEAGDGLEFARFDLLPLPGDGAGLVAQDDDVPDESLARIPVIEWGDVEVEKARLGISHHEIAVHDAARGGDFLPIKPREKVPDFTADRLFRIEAEKVAGGLVDVVDRSLRPGDDDPLAEDLEDFLKETLFLHDLQDEALDLLGLEAVEPVEETINHAGIHGGGHGSRVTGNWRNGG